MTSSQASTGLRVAAGLSGAVFLSLGAILLISALGVLPGLIQGELGAWYTRRDTVYVVVWAVFAVSLIAAGAALLYSMWRARRSNLVPGPALYVAGASLMIIAFFLVAGGTLLPALLAATLGGALLIAEYASETV